MANYLDEYRNTAPETDLNNPTEVWGIQIEDITEQIKNISKDIFG